MAQDNLYLVLGIFDFNDDLVGTADDDQRVLGIINGAWETKKAEWSKAKTKNAKKASKASNYLEQEKRRRNELNTMQARRDAWTDARQSIDSEINKQLGMFLLKGSLLTSELEIIAETVSKSVGVTVSTGIVRALVPENVEIGESEQAHGKKLEQPKDLRKFKNNDATLDAYHYDNLYELLDHPQTPEGHERNQGGRIVRQSAATLKKWAEEDKKVLPTKATTEVGDHKKLFEACCDIFSSEESKERYDSYLEYRAIEKALNDAELVASAPKKLDDSVIRGLVRRMQEASSQLGRTLETSDAEAYLQYMCSEKGFVYAGAISDDSANAAPQYEVCPWCGKFLELGARVCTSCGPIRVACSKCGTENLANVKYCASCGNDYGNLKLARNLADEASQSIRTLRFDEAQQLLDNAESLWASLPEIAEQRSALETNRQQIGELPDQLHEAVEHHEFCKAKQLYDDIVKRVPGFSDPQLQDRIEAGIENAKGILAQAGANPGLDAALRAYEACRDYPGLGALLAANPPTSAANVTVRTDGVRRANIVTWDASPTEHVVYKVIRKVGSRPLDDNDGTEVERTAGTSVTDEGIEPNTEYHYAVVATLGPLAAAMACADAAVNYFDVKNVNLTAEDGAIRITWNGVPKNAEVEAWRTAGTVPPAKPGDGERVGNVIAGGLQDTGLRNGTEYRYAIFVGYKDAAGRVHHSAGQTVSGIPTAPPEPIEFVIPQLQPDDSFTLQWDEPTDGESRFFLSREGVALNMGDAVPLTQLEGTYDELAIDRTGSETGTFTLPNDAVYNLIPATVKDGTAFIGTVCTVTRRKVVQIDKIMDSGGNAVIMFDWPQESCDRVLLLRRTDHYAAGPNERGSVRLSVSKKTYDLLKAIKVENLADKTTYYFSLFAQLGSGDSISYSAPSNKTFSFGKSSSATYWVETSSMFGRIRSAKLVIESTGDVPACELRVSMGTLPVFRSQGTSVLDVPEQSGAGRHEFPIPTDGLRKKQQYKLFFTDDDEYDRTDLVLKPGASSEIG